MSKRIHAALDRQFLRWTVSVCAATLVSVFSVTISSAEKLGVSDGCDCANSQISENGTYCSADRVSYTSSRGTKLTVIFDDPDGGGPEDNQYECGQYANGDVWVVGKPDGGGKTVVRVSSTTPSWDASAIAYEGGVGGRHGWMTNPELGENHLDGRQDSTFIPPTSSDSGESLPRSYDVTSGYVSFIKQVGRDTEKPFHKQKWEVCNIGTQDRFGCAKFNGIVSFAECKTGCANSVDSDGDGVTYDEFRPSYAGSGASKVSGLRVDDFATLAETLPRLDHRALPSAELSKWKIEKVANNWRWPRLDHKRGWMQWTLMGIENFTDSAPGCSGCNRQEYGTEMAGTNAIAILRMLLDDFHFGAPGTAGYQALVNFLQYGVDTYGNYRIGKRWGPPQNGHPIMNSGGHFAGRKIVAAFAAYMFEANEVHGRAMVQWAGADSGNFFESDEVNMGSNGVPYYGFVIQDCAGLTSSDDHGRNQCQTFIGSGNAAPARMDSQCFTGSGTYPSVSSNPKPYERLVVKALEIERVWNDDPYLDFAYSWFEGGREPGHTQGAWCAPDGLANGWNRFHNSVGVNYKQNDFGNAMWEVFKDINAGSIAPPVTGGGPAPPIVLND